jgi:hypothetical protein
LGFVLAAMMLLLPESAFGHRYAILTLGFTNSAFRIDLSHVYIMLTEAGYPEEDIFVLYHDGEQLDLDGDGFIDDVDDSCTSSTLSAVFDSLENLVDIANVLFFFGTGHGGSLVRPGNGYPNGCIFFQDYADTLWDFQLAAAFEDLEDAAGGPLRKICLIPGCHGGGFLTVFNDEPENLCGLREISASSAVRYDQNSWYDNNDGYAMTYWWTSALRGQDWDGVGADADANNDSYVSLREAFRFAESKSKTDTQTPVHWAKGCLLDHFTGVQGAPFPLSLFVINMTCCPWYDVHPWMPRDCWNLGLTVTASIGKGTLEARARVANGGTAPSTGGNIQYFYRAPTLGLGFYDTGWIPVGTGTIPPMAPGDTLDLDPLPFTVPPTNPFGETHWTFAARILDPSNPPESGWLVDDHQVKMVNHWTVEADPGEMREVRFYAVNPTPDTAHVVLTLDASGYPPEWTCLLDPPAGDTVAFLPNESRIVTLAMQPTSIGSGAGTIDVYETLLSKRYCGACTDPGCQDTTCGGFIRVTGGCAVTLLTQPTGIAEGEDAGQDAILLVRPTVVRREASVELSLAQGSFVRLGVYDVAGRRVKDLLRSSLAPGLHGFLWDGCDERGRPAAPGCYFVRAEVEGSSVVRRIVKAE